MQRLQVLTIEDDPAIRRGIVDALTFAGYRPFEAADGARGLALAVERSYDLLLLDLVHSAGLPNGNGDKLARRALFERIKRSVYNRGCRLKLIWADGACEDMVAWVKQQFGWALEIARRPPQTKGLVGLPRR